MSGARPAVTRRRSAAATSVRGVNYSTSPLLASKTPPWRSRFLVMLVGLGFLALAGRALYVQVIESDFFQKKGEERYASTIQLPASRGRIRDRHGQILAISVNAPTISVNPQQFKANQLKAVCPQGCLEQDLIQVFVLRRQFFKGTQQLSGAGHVILERPRTGEKDFDLLFVRMQAKRLLQ